MFSFFFIERPKFALVVSLVISLIGVISIPILPIGEYPNLAPPQVQVSASYTGADAAVVRDTVASVIEDRVNGVERMIYMSSKSSNDGSYTLSVTFEPGADPDMAQVRVQNKVQQATASLPAEVVARGVTVDKKSANLLQCLALFSPNGSYDGLFLANYATLYVRDALVRVPGVSEVKIFDQRDYGMRLWLDPDKMAAMEVTVSDVVAALQAHNVQVPAGMIGAEPVRGNQAFQYTVRTQGRLQNEAEFAAVPVRAVEGGATIRLKDLVRDDDLDAGIKGIELGAEFYFFKGYLDNQPSSVIGIYPLPEANAMAVAEGVRQAMDELKGYFPNDLDWAPIYDTTEFIQSSIDEVIATLYQAVLLVVLVVFIFLQDWRATLVPTIAIPVALIGTFGVLLVAGMTINTVSLFGLILAIGIVVDDAILVVENTSRLLAEGKSPKEATRQTMSEVSGAVIATTLVLYAVFVPVALLPGISGVMYQQFAVTILVAVGLSSINALTLAPALCSLLLKPPKAPDQQAAIWRWYNRLFDAVTAGYGKLVRAIVGKIVVVLILVAAVFWGTGSLFSSLPTGFIPSEDKGAFFVDIQLPDAASSPRTDVVVKEVTDKLLAREDLGIAHVLSVPGYSMLKGAVSSNSALAIVTMVDHDERPGVTQAQAMRALQGEFMLYPSANVMLFAPPPVPGIGNASGVELVLQDRLGRSPTELANALGGLVVGLNEADQVGAAFATFRANVPQLWIDFDRDKAEVLGVSRSQVSQTLQAYLGSLYVNDFNKFGKTYKVLIQAGDTYRDDPDDIRRFWVRGQDSQMVQLGTMVDVEPILGPEVVERYNLLNSANITVLPAPGMSTGDAIAAIERVGKDTLPEGYGWSYSGMTYQELEAGNLAPIAFMLAIVFVYLFLVAQYESWTIPMAVMLGVPIAMFGALVTVWLTGADVNLYTQIGMVILIGIASKTAILVVEFARQLHEQEGLSVKEAAIKAGVTRFRAVLMTAISFILGMVPMVIASGPGSVSRQALGQAVFGGMLVSLVAGTLLVPGFYMMIQSMRNRFKGKSAPQAAVAGATSESVAADVQDDADGGNSAAPAADDSSQPNA